MSSTRLRETIRKEDGKLYATHEKKVRSRQILSSTTDVRFVISGNGRAAAVADWKGSKNWKTISEILDHLRAKGFTADAYARVCIEEADLHPEIEIPTWNDFGFCSYIETALWSSTMEWIDEDDEEQTLEGLDRAYSIEDLEAQTHRNLYSMWQRFQKENSVLLEEAMRATGNDLRQAAHDFWLTAGGHGAGFRDGDWDTDTRDYGKELTEVAKKFNTESTCWYLSEDGKLALDGLYSVWFGVNLSTMEIERFPEHKEYLTKTTLVYHTDSGKSVRLDTVSESYDYLG